MKIGITLDERVVERIDKYADENYMSRSGLISLACTQFLNTAELSVLLRDMSLAMRKIADTGTLDDDTMQQLEDFERFAKMVRGNV